MMREEKRAVALLGSAHFFVDFACTAMLGALSARLPHSQIILCAILYNGLAFAFQLPIGALADGCRLSRSMAAFGCVLVAAGAWFAEPLPICLLIGLGNACFHVGGGREALHRGKGSAGIVGRFVAPGAIGIFLGPRLAALSWLRGIVLPLVLLLLAGTLFLSRRQGQRAEQLRIGAAGCSPGRLAGLLVCMFLTVLLRSYMGTVLRFPLFSGFGWAAGFTLCVFAGKYFGGILSDRFGVLRFGAAAQLLSAVLLALSPFFAPLALPGIFLFNTSMAVTANALYKAMPQYGGTMFGLTTFALFLGVLPRLLGWENVLFTWWGLLGMGLVSAALLLGGLILGTGGGTDAPLAPAVAGADTDP